MAEITIWYLPGGIPGRTKVPSARVTVPLEVLLRKTLTPARGLPLAESLTDPDRTLFCDWAKTPCERIESRKTVSKETSGNKIFFIKFRGGILSRECRQKCVLIFS